MLNIIWVYVTDILGFRFFYPSKDDVYTYEIPEEFEQYKGIMSTGTSSSEKTFTKSPTFTKDQAVLQRFF